MLMRPELIAALDEAEQETQYAEEDIVNRTIETEADMQEAIAALRELGMNIEG